MLGLGCPKHASAKIATPRSSGWNIRVANKAQISWHSIKKQLKRWLSQCFYERHGEANYRGIKPRIMIEPLLSEDQGELRDYKLYFCNGKYLGAHVDFNRFSDHQYRIYDVAWNEFEKEDPNIVRNLPLCPRPEKLDEMIEIGLKLSQGFPYVRVDLYYPQGQIFSGESLFLRKLVLGIQAQASGKYLTRPFMPTAPLTAFASLSIAVSVGELTFTPGNGLARYDPIESDFYLGAPFNVLPYLNTPYYEPHWTPTSR
ncbi:hypothetical protein BOW53_03165 [Solemya pervernicosa gill symbiont]|uniref:Uncharacterized protein n=1 Tax=Solemya pervernicosa gill symbiont TaxID=642797 RepID=A0A1T2L915_9GAMM|nr:ATP-grasp fold amidoligase family protein [Solemya pervernicosa gill symbiont]OOZ41524.1 hypothetical protein BOW53_03165 [Solemya pervernicosa gill symbiont]